LPTWRHMKKQKIKNGIKKSEGSHGGGWEIIYTGFILILLCFFIMLSSFTTMEEAKVMRFVRSFASAVSILSGGLKFDAGTAILSESSDIVDYKSDLAKIFEDLQVLVQKLNLEDDVKVSFSQEGLVMRLAEHAIFDLGVARLSSTAMPLLDKIGAIISRTPYSVRIEGHTDNIPINTTMFPSNWELSTARAVNVLRYLIRTHSISPLRLSAEGFGEYQPLYPNDTADRRAQNRRVEIIFIKSDPEAEPPGVHG
jgi:chemotaxis protein MotB